MKKLKKQLRKKKTIELLLKGCSLEQIGAECGVTEKTVRRDLLEISKEYPEMKQECAVLLIENQRDIFREAVELYDSVETTKDKCRVLMLRMKIVNSLEKLYSRFGLIPSGEEDLTEENEVMFTKGQWRKMMSDISDRVHRDEARKREEAKNQDN